MNSQTIFEIIGKMKTELKQWDEFSKPHDPFVKLASIDTLEELESRLRQRFLDEDANRIAQKCIEQQQARHLDPL